MAIEKIVKPPVETKTPTKLTWISLGCGEGGLTIMCNETKAIKQITIEEADQYVYTKEIRR